MSYIQSLHHIIIRTKYSDDVLPNEYSEELYRYIWGYIKNKKSFLYRINGMPNHVHILVGIHSTIALADFVKELKTSTNSWIKTNKDKFPDFISWGEKYGAFTIRYQEKDIVIAYIKNQREHHKNETFKDEYRRLIADNGIDIDEQYFLTD
ncbi:MAG: transposase [Bacteroidetes bacterium]|nr:transposase [Bacteroidota bacterium]